MGNYTYRALSDFDIENIKKGKEDIVCKNPESPKKIDDFILNGSRTKEGTRFISTTESIGVASVKYAMKYSEKSGKFVIRDQRMPIILINLDQLEEKSIHTVEETGLSPRTQQFKWSKADKEKIIEFGIKKDAFSFIPPILVDILYACESCNVQKESTENIINIINDGNAEEFIKMIFKGIEINEIEKDFIKLYYGIDVNNNEINVKNQNKEFRENLTGVSNEISKKYGIEANKFTSNCIRTQIIKNLLTKGILSSILGKGKFSEYLGPIDEMSPTTTINHNTKYKIGDMGISVKEDRTVDLPYGVKYEIDTKTGKVIGITEMVKYLYKERCEWVKLSQSGEVKKHRVNYQKNIVNMKNSVINACKNGTTLSEMEEAQHSMEVTQSLKNQVEIRRYVEIDIIQILCYNYNECVNIFYKFGNIF